MGCSSFSWEILELRSQNGQMGDTLIQQWPSLKKAKVSADILRTKSHSKRTGKQQVRPISKWK